MRVDTQAGGPMTEPRNLAARARAAIVLLQEQHCRVRRVDGEPHPPTDECDCGLADACQVIVDLLEVARELGEHALQLRRQGGWAWGELTPEAQREYADAGLGPLGAAGKGRPLSEMVDLEPRAVWEGEVAPFVTMETDAGEAAMTTMEDDRGAKDKD